MCGSLLGPSYFKIVEPRDGGVGLRQVEMGAERQIEALREAYVRSLDQCRAEASPTETTLDDDRPFLAAAFEEEPDRDNASRRTADSGRRD